MIFLKEVRITLNEDYIVKLIEGRLNAKRELSEFEFFELFSGLTRQEHYVVIQIMMAHDMDYVDEKEEETIVLDSAEVLQRTELDLDYKGLLSLTNEQLCVMAQDGNKTAIASLVEKNKRFIYQNVKQLQKQHPNICYTEEDLFQQGCIGLLTAIEKFDRSRDFKFLSYASSWIRQSISRNIMDTGYLIRIPVHFFEKMVRVNNYRRENPTLSLTELTRLIISSESNDGDITNENDISLCLKYSEQYLNTLSLNVLVGEGEDTELLNFQKDIITPTVEEIVISNLMRPDIDKAMESLTDREKGVLRLRYGFDNHQTRTLEEIGHVYGVTRERIRQIEAKALRKLRHPIRSDNLRAYYEEE